MKDLSYVSQEISKGHNLSVNLEKYATGMTAMYDGLAYVKLSMNYYTVFDILREKNSAVPGFQELLDRMQNVIASQVLTHGDGSRSEIEAIRNEIISIMETITSYVDRLRIYEYVLNRVEYRFTDQELDEQYYGMYLTNDLMHYIFSDKDNVVINSKISEIVAQLPMRLSRPKLYEYIRDAFTLYHGAQIGTINDFVYALKTSAMINDIGEQKDLFPDVRDICETLANADYKNITQDEYNRLKGALTIGAQQMNDYADLYVLFAQMVNDVYTIILSGETELEPVEEIETAKEIIAAVKAGYESENGEFEEEVVEKFTQFEGIQERILSAVSKCDFAIDIALNNYKEQLSEFGMAAKYEALADIVKLQSGSDFVSLTVSEDKQTVPEDSYADQQCEQFIQELDQSFGNMHVQIRRAVMSAVLSQLPVFFNNTDEIQEYINLSLELCNDQAERMAVVDVCKMIIEGNI